jgi:hypothetical protein
VKKETNFLTAMIFMLIGYLTVQGQILLEENFDYAGGDSLPNQTWAQIRNGEKIKIISPGLTYPGYTSSGIGNAAKVVSDGNQEVRSTFSKQTSDSLYLSYLINVDSTSTDYGVYLYLGASDADIFHRYLTAYISSDESDKISFGVAKNSGIKTTAFDYNFNETYLILLKYKFIPGDENDEVSIWINPPLVGSEPEPDRVSTSGVDADSLGGIVLSQITASNKPPNAIIDGIRITTQWEDIPSAINDPLIATANTYVLEQNYPNPFNPSTKIRFSLPKSEYVSIEIFNTLGQNVKTLLSKRLNAGHHEVDFMAHDLAAGLYYYSLRTSETYQVKKMILLK